MIHVIANIHFDTDRLEDLRALYHELVPNVLEEEGCIQYQPTFDLDTDLPNQEKNNSVITVTEIWESIEAFNAHLSAPHVIRFRDQIPGIVNNITVKILQPFQ